MFTNTFSNILISENFRKHNKIVEKSNHATKILFYGNFPDYQQKYPKHNPEKNQKRTVISQPHRPDHPNPKRIG